MTAIAPDQATGPNLIVTTPVPARERLFEDAVSRRSRTLEFRMWMHRPRRVTVVELFTIGALLFVAGVASVGWMVLA